MKKLLLAALMFSAVSAFAADAGSAPTPPPQGPTLQVMGNTKATIIVNGKPYVAGTPLPAGAKITVKGGDATIKIGGATITAKSGTSLTTSGSNITVTAGSAQVTNAGGTTTVNAGGTINAESGAVTSTGSTTGDSSLVPPPPPPPNNQQNVEVNCDSTVSGSTPCN